ncbi:MAG: PDZ domain-containing protein [Planctomycetota bacterium]|nr:PDZ domain-containing protein [Planctomycetota bacterium]
MDKQSVRIIAIVLLLGFLTAGGCYLPVHEHRLPAEADHFTLTYSTVGYRPVNVSCELNSLSGYSAAVLEHTVSGVAVRVQSPKALAEQADVLCDALSSMRREAGLYFSPMPFFNITLLDEPPATGVWHGDMVGNRFSATFYTNGAGVSSTGAVRTSGPFLASQVLGTFSECLEYCSVYGDGVKLPSNTRRWRWFREGLCLWLSYKGITDRFKGARPAMNSPLEFKYYWATKLGARLLEWREGQRGDKYYAASAGVFFAANEATGGAFPYNFLRAMHDDDEELALIAADALGCSPLDFATSIRRPIPELYPEFCANEMVVPDSFDRSADAMTLRSGDVVLAVAGRHVSGLYELDKALWDAVDGEDFTLTVRRDGRKVDVHCLPMGWRHLLARLTRGER